MVKSKVDLESGVPRGDNASGSLWTVFGLRGVGPSTESSRGSPLTPDLEASLVAEEPRRKDEMDSSGRAHRFPVGVQGGGKKVGDLNGMAGFSGISSHRCITGAERTDLLGTDLGS